MRPARSALLPPVVAVVLPALLAALLTAAAPAPPAQARAVPVAGPEPLSPAQVGELAVRVRAGLAADTRPRTRSAYDGAPTTKACYGQDRDSRRDGTRLDVAQYGAFYGCLTPGEWLFPVTTYEPFAPEQVRLLAFHADGDQRSTTGCGGFETTVVGTYTDGELAAAVLHSPTCDTSTWTYRAAADLQQPGSRDIGLLFRNADLGSPSTLRWYAQVQAVGEAGPERLPGLGAHLEADYIGASAACGTPSGTRWYTEASGSRAVEALDDAGATSLTRTRAGLTSFRTSDPEAAQAALRAVDPTAAVRPDTGLRLAAVPRDPQVAQQWYLDHVRASDAWDVTRGSRTVVVAVVDTGADFTHPDLQGKLTGGYDAVRRVALTSGNPDRIGHGTAVAGMVAAATDNGVGIAGLGWETRVMPIKVDDGNGQLVTSAVIDAIRYAADRGARVLNLSLGGCRQDPQLTSALQYAIGKGVLPVAAAGNEALEGNPVEYPAADAGVLAVGATARDLTRARYSNFGPYVDLVAPGGSASGQDADDLLMLQTGGGTVREAGTSFSAPLVSAAAALLVAQDPTARPADLTSRLLGAARDLGPAGRDDEFGAGLLDAAAAVGAPGAPLSPPTSASPVASPSASPVASPVVPPVAPPSPTAAASPPGTAGTPPAPPTLAVSPSRIDPGTAVVVSGTAEPGARLELLAYSRPSTTYAVARRAVTSSGQYTFRVTPGTNTRLYVRATTSGGSASSGTAVVEVQSRVSLTVTRAGTRTYRFSGSLLPRRGGVTVAVLRDGVLAARTTTAPDGTWRLVRAFTGTGTFGFSARAGATSTNAAGQSAVQRVAVR